MNVIDTPETKTKDKERRTTAVLVHPTCHAVCVNTSRVLKERIMHYVFRTALAMARQQGPQAAWYIGQSGHELG